MGVYQAAFALTTMLLEAKPEWSADVPGLDGYHYKLLEYSKLFQGCRCLRTAQDLADICVLVGGSLQTLWGLLFCLMHLGDRHSTLGAWAESRGTAADVSPEVSQVVAINVDPYLAELRTEDRGRRSIIGGRSGQISRVGSFGNSIGKGLDNGTIVVSRMS